MQVTYSVAGLSENLNFFHFIRNMLLYKKFLLGLIQDAFLTCYEASCLKIWLFACWAKFPRRGWCMDSIHLAQLETKSLNILPYLGIKGWKPTMSGADWKLYHTQGSCSRSETHSISPTLGLDLITNIYIDWNIFSLLAPLLLYCSERSCSEFVFHLQTPLGKVLWTNLLNCLWVKTRVKVQNWARLQ